MDWSNYRLIQVHLQLFLWVFKIEGGLRTDSTFGIEFNYFYTPDNYIVSNSNPLKTSFDEIKSQKNVLDFWESQSLYYTFQKKSMRNEPCPSKWR